MPQILDHNLHRQLNHDHTAQNNTLYLLKAGDTATGTIVFPVTASQGNALVNSINVGTTLILASHVSIVDAGNYYTSTTVEGALQEIGAAVFTDFAYRRIMLLMGA